MNHHEFDPNCPDCRPVLIDIDTNQPLPVDHPAMVAMLKVWATAPREEQEAFHRISVDNLQKPGDLELAQAMWERVEKMVS